MDYVLKSAKAQGLPYSKKENPLDPNSPVVYGINTIVKTGVVGQNYAGFENTDLGFCPLLETDTIAQAEAKIQAYGAVFVAQKYPNT